VHTARRHSHRRLGWPWYRPLPFAAPFCPTSLRRPRRRRKWDFIIRAHCSRRLFPAKLSSVSLMLATLSRKRKRENWPTVMLCGFARSRCQLSLPAIALFRLRERVASISETG